MSLTEHPNPGQQKPKALRSSNGKLLPGAKLGQGRPQGSRDQLTRAFLFQLADTFQRKGKAAMERLADTDPAAFIRVCASLMPKDIKVSSGPLGHLSEQELDALAYAAQRLADAGNDNADSVTDSHIE